MFVSKGSGSIAHLLSASGGRAPDTRGQTFLLLAETGVIDTDIAVRLSKAVGFRNIAIHAYEQIDWAIVHSICQTRSGDFEDLAIATSGRGW